ncbi:MAG: phosphotransferase family protein, partial [Planctomycetota bacterium]
MRHAATAPARRAIDAAQVLGALREAGVVGSELRSLSLDRAWPWRTEGTCALFLDRREPPGRREWIVLQAPDAKLPRRLRQAAARAGARRVEALGGLVLPPAGDPELPTLDLLDPRVATSRLQRRWGGEADGRLDVRLRGYKPLRRVTVEYRSRGGGDGAGRSLYGKALRRPDLARVRATYAALARSAAADSLVLPHDVVERWGMMLFDHQPGTALERLVPGPAAVRGVELAGETLAALHTSGAGLPAAHDRPREWQTLDRWLRCAARSCPEMATKLHASRQLLQRLGDAIGAGCPVPSHRDYHPGQLLVAPDGVAVLDLDTAAMAEPELDVGNFLAHLDLFELDRRLVEAASLGEAFRSAYESRVGRRLRSRRLLWYHAGAVLRLACVYRFRPRGALLGTL